MRAVYDGRDFHIYLDTRAELIKFERTTPYSGLTCCLTDLNGKEIDKRVDIMRGEAKNPDGIDLIFEDDDELEPLNDFDTCIQIRISVNDRGYANLNKLKHAVATYGNTENKVRVVDFTRQAELANR